MGNGFTRICGWRYGSDTTETVVNPGQTAQSGGTIGGTLKATSRKATHCKALQHNSSPLLGTTFIRSSRSVSQTIPGALSGPSSDRQGRQKCRFCRSKNLPCHRGRSRRPAYRGTRASLHIVRPDASNARINYTGLTLSWAPSDDFKEFHNDQHNAHNPHG